MTTILTEDRMQELFGELIASKISAGLTKHALLGAMRFVETADTLLREADSRRAGEIADRIDGERKRLQKTLARAKSPVRQAALRLQLQRLDAQERDALAYLAALSGNVISQIECAPATTEKPSAKDEPKKEKGAEDKPAKPKEDKPAATPRLVLNGSAKG